jgi:hypothetical protein
LRPTGTDRTAGRRQREEKEAVASVNQERSFEICLRTAAASPPIIIFREGQGTDGGTADGQGVKSYSNLWETGSELVNDSAILLREQPQ